MSRHVMARGLLAMVGALAVVIASPGVVIADDGGGSARSDSSDVGGQAGALATSVPVKVPGFHGLEPALSIDYNSNRNNGLLGVGWRLDGLSLIERASPGRGAPGYGAADIFLLDGEELVPCATLGGTHCTKRQSFLRIARDATADTWTLVRTDGTREVYRPVFTVTGGTFRWALSSVTDTHGNTVSYTWWCDPGKDCYPDTIVYNGTTIRFHREVRPDEISFATGASIGSTRFRLKTIDVTVGGARARAYKMGYTTSANTGRSLLASVREYGADAVLDATGTVTGGTALPAHTLGYSDTAASWGQTHTWPTQGHMITEYTINTASSTAPKNTQEGVTFGDFNGDGRQDIVWSFAACQTYGQPGCPHNEIWLKTDSGYSAGPAWPTAGFIARAPYAPTYYKPKANWDGGVTGTAKSAGSVFSLVEAPEV